MGKTILFGEPQDVLSLWLRGDWQACRVSRVGLTAREAVLRCEDRPPSLAGGMDDDARDRALALLALTPRGMQYVSYVLRPGDAALIPMAGALDGAERLGSGPDAPAWWLIEVEA